MGSWVANAMESLDGKQFGMASIYSCFAQGVPIQSHQDVGKTEPVGLGYSNGWTFGPEHSRAVGWADIGPSR